MTAKFALTPRFRVVGKEGKMTRFHWPMLLLLVGWAAGTKFTFDQVAKIQPGMTRAEVRRIMPATATDVFYSNRDLALGLVDGRLASWTQARTPDRPLAALFSRPAAKSRQLFPFRQAAVLLLGPF